MTAPGWYNEGKKLEEGEEYAFSFIKVITLSDEEEYMIMEDPYGIRHLIPCEFYRSYNLQTGASVVCRVVKINCTGRVFIEPEHPFYKAGAILPFPVLKIIRDPESVQPSRIIVSDIFGNEIAVDGNGALSTLLQSNQVTCVIEEIKKGRPVLRMVDTVCN